MIEFYQPARIRLRATRSGMTSRSLAAAAPRGDSLTWAWAHRTFL